MLGRRYFCIFGPDLSGDFGTLHGIGGLEATISLAADGSSVTEEAAPIKDFLGNILGYVDGIASGSDWSPTATSAYHSLVSALLISFENNSDEWGDIIGFEVLENIKSQIINNNAPIRDMFSQPIDQFNGIASNIIWSPTETSAYHSLVSALFTPFENNPDEWGDIRDMFSQPIDQFNGIASNIIWSPTETSAYGPAANTTVKIFGEDTDKWIEALSWRGYSVDPTGFIHMGEREYDYHAGRFISTDPLGHAATPDLYSFAAGDPINVGDPTGRFNQGLSSLGYHSQGNIHRAQAAYSAGQIAAEHGGPDVNPSQVAMAKYESLSKGDPHTQAQWEANLMGYGGATVAATSLPALSVLMPAVALELAPAVVAAKNYALYKANTAIINAYAWKGTQQAATFGKVAVTTLITAGWVGHQLGINIETGGFSGVELPHHLQIGLKMFDIGGASSKTGTFFGEYLGDGINGAINLYEQVYGSSTNFPNTNKFMPIGINSKG